MPLDGAAARLPVAVRPPAGELSLWRTIRVVRRNVLGIVPEAAYRLPVIASRRARLPWRMVMDPDGIEHVLKTREAIYPRSDVTLRLLKPREGESLFTAAGAEWRWMRRAAAPVFAPRSLAALAPAMTAAAEAASRRLAAAAEAGAPVDLYEEMVTTAFDVIRDTALAGDPSLDRAKVARAVTRFILTMGRVSILDVLGAPGWIPRPARLFAPGARSMDRMVDRIVAARRAAGPAEPPDLLDLMAAAEDGEGGRRMGAVELRNNLVAFIVAGHETTALALAWALYLVAFDPAVQARARDAAQAALGDRAATAADLPALGYVRQVLDEAMRLYPPAGFMARTAKAPDDGLIGGPVTPGETVMLPIYALHRHRLLWDDPDAFDPDRFAPDRAAARHRFAYLPFGAGPRVCVGMGFALMEATIVLATLLARFRFRLAPGPGPVPELLVTLRPTGGVRLVVERA